jgi:4-hydroxybenzoate polyprenyltransferase
METVPSTIVWQATVVPYYFESDDAQWGFRDSTIEGRMITRSSLAHIRLPFSYFLLPIYFLALVSVKRFDPIKAWIIFFVLHFLLYTASNGFNSFYDRDTKSIGALRRPPTVTPDLLWLSLALDAFAIVAAFFAGWQFACGCFVYGLGSKAYSWNKIRIKKLPIIGWLWAGIGQGTLTFLLIVVSVKSGSLHDISAFDAWLPAMAAGLFILGIFPITQIYQHGEDGRRGDITISLRLGVRGTFLLSAVFMTASSIVLSAFFLLFRGPAFAAWFLALTAPAAIYFFRWFALDWTDEAKADYTHTMRLCIIASTGINVFGLGVLIQGSV